MTRKDTILIAVVINASLLAILFTTAIIYDTDKVLDQGDLQTNLVINEEVIKPLEEQPHLVAIADPVKDEVDQVISNDVVVVDNSDDQPEESEPVVQASTPIAKEEKKAETKEVIVKKGDVLEKIAKAHGSSVAAIKKANQLKNEKLKIGQILKVPPKKDKAKKKTEGIIAAATNDADAVYHTVKSGDSPWKMAKKYGVEYEDILKLNDIDEEKARNLKIGDKIRVK